MYSIRFEKFSINLAANRCMYISFSDEVQSATSVEARPVFFVFSFLYFFALKTYERLEDVHAMKKTFFRCTNIAAEELDHVSGKRRCLHLLFTAQLMDTAVNGPIKVAPHVS